jgi:hypothetical protein
LHTDYRRTSGGSYVENTALQHWSKKVGAY